MNIQHIALILSWLPFSFCIAGSIAQIRANHRAQSTRGLSPSMIFLFFMSVAFLILYTYSHPLPISHRVLLPIHLFGIGILSWQGYYYTSSQKLRFNIAQAYVSLAAILILCIATMQLFPEAVGSFAGWVSTLLPLLTQIPQMVRNARRKSVEGFSFWFVFLATLAVLLDLYITITLQLPAQSLFSALRGLIYYTIYYVQFALYSKPHHTQLSA